MISTMPSCPRLAIAALLGFSMSYGAYAQQTPITGQMGSPPASPVVANVAASPAISTPSQSMPDTGGAPVNTEVGSTTRLLLSMQSQGNNAGKSLPIPGQEASASYQRYLKSFEHPIPEFYEAAVSKNAGSTSNSSGMP
jgi:hypothetical protein